MKTGKKKRVIPGFGLSLGVTISMLSIIVLIPMISVVVTSTRMGFDEFFKVILSKRVLAAFKVTFMAAFGATVINGFFGVILAWVLVRYQFPFKRFFDGLIELPFALPTAVAGIALTHLYSSEGWFGKILLHLGIKVSYTRIGIVIAMVFIGIPFIVRSIQPVLEKLDIQFEEAGTMLGASRARIFFKIIFPEILPALLTGFGLAFARVLGEYGSIIFIAGNQPYETEIASLMIMNKLQQFDYEGATAIAVTMLVFAFIILFLINSVQIFANKFSKE